MFKQNVCCHNKSEKVHINGKQKSQKIKFSMLSEMLIAYEKLQHYIDTLFIIVDKPEFTTFEHDISIIKILHMGFDLQFMPPSG